MAWDGASGRLMVFGGTDRNNQVQFGDTWEWDGTNWVRLDGGPSPSPRNGASVAWDPTTKELVLVGGVGTRNGTNFIYSDTWTWNGTTWAPAAPRPDELTGTIAWDPATAQLLLIAAGRNPTTWVWDSSTWQPMMNDGIRDPNRPTGAVEMAFDPTRRQLLMAYGTGVTPPQLYAWNGSIWAPLGLSLPTRSNAAVGLVTDQKSGHLMAVVAEGTFELTPNGWSKLSSAGSVESRVFAAVAYDPSLDVPIVFGGMSTLTSALLEGGFAWKGAAWQRAW